jgi:hypothetical protein
MEIGCVATLATLECMDEVRLFLASLRQHHPSLPVLVGASSAVAATLRKELPHDKAIMLVPCLDQYGPIDRRAMEATKGVWFPSRHCDFMMEKANVMQLALERGVASNVLFLDCDVVTLAPLPRLAADRSVVFGVSPHGIAAADEALWGRYNGGVVWTADPRLLFEWRRFTHRSRFHDQASLEDVVAHCRSAGIGVHEFGPEVNYGYWRMMQKENRSAASFRSDSAFEEAGRFRSQPGQPIRYVPGGGAVSVPLQSVHTHFFLQKPPAAMAVFNSFVRRLVRIAGPDVYRAVHAALR